MSLCVTSQPPSDAAAEEGAGEDEGGATPVALQTMSTGLGQNFPRREWIARSLGRSLGPVEYQPTTRSRAGVCVRMRGLEFLKKEEVS